MHPEFCAQAASGRGKRDSRGVGAQGQYHHDVVVAAGVSGSDARLPASSTGTEPTRRTTSLAICSRQSFNGRVRHRVSQQDLPPWWSPTGRGEAWLLAWAPLRLRVPAARSAANAVSSTRRRT